MKKRIISLFLVLALALTAFSAAAFADDGETQDFGSGFELRFDGQPWKAYAVESIDTVLTLGDLHVTVVDREGTEVPADAYDLSVETETDWDEENNCPITEPYTGELKIDGPDNIQAGFIGFCLIARAKDGSGYTGATRPQEFMIWHRYSFNWFGANATFGAEYERPCTWSWHNFYKLPEGWKDDPEVYGIAQEDPIDPQYYTLTYYNRVTGVPVSDGPDYQEKVYPETDSLAGMPTENGTYFVKIEGKAPYYGTSYIDFDIVQPESYVFERGDHEGRYYDGETVMLEINSELYLGFDLEPYSGLIPGWRNDLLAEQGFVIDDEPTMEGNYAYAHIKAGTKKAGESGVLTYNWYRFEDIFGPDAPGWMSAVPVYTATVRIQVWHQNILGDSDGDGEVSILDATAIQRVLAGLPTEKECILLAADSDRDGDLTILDATIIQRHLASIPSPGHEGIAEDIAYGTYYAGWNISEELLPDGCGLTGAEAERAREEIRRALNLLIDRRYIAEDILTQIGGVAKKTPANSFVSKWITDADGSEFHANAGQGGQGYYNAIGYEQNVNEAVEILKKYYQYDDQSGKFTNIPKLTYIHNYGDVHAAIANKIKNDFAEIGVELVVEAKDWFSYQDTLAEKKYSLARSGWVIDNDNPLEFLEIFTSDNEDNDIGFGQGAYQDAAVYSLDLSGYGIDVTVENGTWAQTYNVLIDTIRNCGDRAIAYGLMHLAEDMLMSTGCIVPLYYY